MTARRFVGATARDCLRRAKEELGPDAVVISNKAVHNGVEIVAMSPESLDAISHNLRPALSAAQAPTAAAPRGSADDDYTVTLSAARNAIQRSAPRDPPLVRAWSPYDSVDFAAAKTPVPPAAAQLRTQLPGAAASAIPSDVPLRPAAGRAQPPEAVAPRAVGEAAPKATAEVSSQTLQLMDEMRIIKDLLERQLAGFAWGEMAREAPTRALLLGEMLAAGFSGSLTRRLVQEMAADLGQDEGRKWLTAAVNRRLRTLSSEADFIDRGGVYALVGPTGVGKTTTTAKLAARCVVRYGAERLALLTTDGYRIGAHEQLRIYGRILGVPVYVVRDGEDLRRTLADLRDKHMVLIDTVGMSQRDRMVAEQASMLSGAGDVRRLLLLNATARGDTLDDVARAYAGQDLAGCIFTKVDEAASLAPALDVAVRHGLEIRYLTNGQRVPEDLHLPNRAYLLHRALREQGAESPWHLNDEEAGMMLAAASGGA